MLAGEQGLLDKLTQALLDSYIDDNKRVKWCPSVPHCGRAIQVAFSFPPSFAVSSFILKSLHSIIGHQFG